MAVFDALQAEGQTIILVTHETDIAQHAHRFVLLRDGVIATDRINERNVAQATYREVGS
jgi:putative ABC transport system ATP-binding protein